MLLRCLPPSFRSIRITVREQITIEDFQDGRRRCCLKIFKMADMAAILDNGMILKIPNLHVAPMPPHQVWAQSNLGFGHHGKPNGIV